MVTTERKEVKATHTPGPWRLNDALEVWAGVSYEAHQQIATVTSFPNIAAPLGDDVVEANALLIAAAPEMYAELERLVESFGWKAHPACRILAKAKGQS